MSKRKKNENAKPNLSDYENESIISATSNIGPENKEELTGSSITSVGMMSDIDSDQEEKNHIKKAIGITIKYMQDKDIKVLDLNEEPNYGSCWYYLSLLIFGEYRYSDASIIMNWYKTDKFKYKSTLIAHFLKERNECAAHSKKKTTKFNRMHSFTLLKTEIDNFKSKSTKRSFLLDGFCDLLTKELQDNCEVKCFLKSSYNWLAAEKFRDSKNKKIWSGVYFCIDNVCHKEFHLHMKNHSENSNLVVVNCQWFAENIHSKKLIKNQRITGIKRKAMAMDIISNGTQLFCSKNPKIKFYIAEKIKSEFNLRNRLNNEMIIDSKCLKRVYLNMLSNDESELSGLVQEICLEPFALLLMSQTQIKIWSVIQMNNNKIWYFDASGRYLKEIENQGDCLLYSVCCHDAERNKVIPIADFFTTGRTTSTILNYLQKIKDTFVKYSHNNVEYKSPSIFVLDEAWPNINAALKVFNNSNAEIYLSWAFQLMVKKVQNAEFVMPTVIQICCFHYLRNLVKKADKVLKYKFRLSKKQEKKMIVFDKKKRSIFQNIRTTFIQSFSILQNSVSFEEFENFFRKIYIIFNTIFKDRDVDDSIKAVREFCKNKRINLDELFEINNSFSKKKNRKKVKINIFNTLSKQILGNVSSPFNVHFNNVIKDIKSTKKKNNFDAQRVKNIFFNPLLFNQILKRIHLLPFWTGILLSSRTNPPLSRLSNNVSEFNVVNLRNHQLDLSKKVRTKQRIMPSQLVAVKYPIILSYFQINYEKEYNSIFKKAVKKNLNHLNDIENWDYPDRIKKRQVSYYSNTDKFGVIDYNEITYDDLIKANYKNKKPTASRSVHDKESDKNENSEDSNQTTDITEEVSINEICRNSVSDTDVKFYEKFYEKFKDQIFFDENHNSGIFNDVHIVNTCSIDYFLLILHLLSSIDDAFLGSLNSFLYSSIITNFDINKARYLWYKDDKKIENGIINYFLSEYDSYLYKYCDIMNYKFEIICEICRKTRQHSQNSFILEKEGSIRSDYLYRTDEVFRLKWNKCHGILRVKGKPVFDKNTPKLIIVKPDNKYEPKLYAIPSNFYLTADKKYLLLGFTVFKNKHFKLILYNGKDHFLIDNMIMSKAKLVNDLSEKIMTIFYYNLE